MAFLFGFLSCRKNQEKEELSKSRPSGKRRRPPKLVSLPERPVTVLFDFDVPIPGTVSVGRGSEVVQLHAVNGWIFVRTLQGNEGYIPETYCRTVIADSGRPRGGEDKGSRTAAVTSPFRPRRTDPAASAPAAARRHLSGSKADTISSGIGPSQYGEESSKETSPIDLNRSTKLEQDINKQVLGVATAVFDFLAERPDEVSVLRGDKVRVLNEDDPDWLWIQTEHEIRGYIPRSYVYWAGKSQETCECCGREAHEFTITPADDKQFWYMDDDEDTTDDDDDDDDVDSPEEDDDDASSTSDPIEADVPSGPETNCRRRGPPPSAHEQRRRQAIVELTAIYDYKGDDAEYLSIKQGEFLYADANDRRDDGWLRVYSSRARRRGLIPALYAQPRQKANRPKKQSETLL